MGRNNSSKTRVQPIFNELVNRDPTGESWLVDLLSLPERTPANRNRSAFKDLGCLECSAFGKHEKQLPAPRSLPRWLLRNAAAQSKTCWKRSKVTNAKRRALLERADPSMLSKAIHGLDRPAISRKAWYSFEGPSQPDVFLQTSELIVVIEGKRTENGPTTCTSWMPVRHQMLRHIDGAIELARQRQVVGFFIVESFESPEGITVPDLWKKAAETTVQKTVLDESLPHRSESQRQAIAEAFLGVTTWQDVCRKFNIEFPR